jgi:hypothetical protein
MGGQARDGLGRQVRALRDQIGRWRQTRVKGGPMPAALWTKAIALARARGTYAIARGVRLDYGLLARRVADATEQDAVGGARAGGFVELTGAQLFGGGAPTGPVVEVAAVDGTRLAIRLPCGAPLDVAAVLHGFRTRPA